MGWREPAQKRRLSRTKKEGCAGGWLPGAHPFPQPPQRPSPPRPFDHLRARSPGAGQAMAVRTRRRAPRSSALALERTEKSLGSESLMTCFHAEATCRGSEPLV